jgi:hypothetical protein
MLKTKTKTETGKGIHFHVFGLAIIDILFTILAAMLTSKYTRTPLIITLPLWFLMGITAHRAFRIRTPIDKFLFTK